MDETADQLFEKVRILLETEGDESTKFLAGINQILPQATVKEEPEVSESNTLTSALGKMNLSMGQMTKLRKFEKGENFSRFCERFQEYVQMTNLKGSQLHLFFLQHVDDETYSTLKTANLEEDEKQNCALFCEIYKKAIYGTDSVPLKNEVLECKQEIGESISTFSHRIREKAAIAFSTVEAIDENSLLALMRGIRNADIRRKLAESSVSNFSEALKFAKKLEKISAMFEPEIQPASILKSSASFSDQMRQENNTLRRDRSRNDSCESDQSDSRWPLGRKYLPHATSYDALSVDETIENGKWEDPTILHEKLGIDQMEISESGKQDLKSLISDYSHCFARNRCDLGKASFYEAKITLKRDFEPQWVPSRPVGYKLEPLMEKEIESMLKADHITRCSYSLWNAQTFLVKKNKGTGPAKGGQPSGEAYRFVQDARALNSQCIQDCYELPRINTILDRMSDCKWLSNLDFQSSFTQIPLRAQDQILTSFQQGGKRYMHTRMVQGQTSSSSQFSRCINHLIMTKIPFDRIILYIDDALLWSPDERSHLLQLRYILNRLTWGNVKLNPDKTRLFQKEVRWLGHWVSSKGVRLDEAKVTAIQSLSPPTTVKQVQRFLGSLNYYRRFMKQFATIAAPLYELLQKGRKFEWTRECQDSFDRLKKALTSSPILCVPNISDENQSYQVTIDSSKRGQGATLTQEIKGERRVIAYWSRAVPKHQQKFGATRLELIALHGALKHWKIYLMELSL
ncbi:hypothetical protein ACHWQZ_G000565 [Mnemiopsis leidyi]